MYQKNPIMDIPMYCLWQTQDNEKESIRRTTGHQQQIKIKKQQRDEGGGYKPEMVHLTGAVWLCVCVCSCVTDLLIEVADQKDPTGPRLSSQGHPPRSSSSRRCRAQRVQGSWQEVDKTIMEWRAALPLHQSITTISRYKMVKGREIKTWSTWDLTEEGVGVFAEGSGHRGVEAGLPVTSRQLRPCVVTTLIVVVLDI